MAAGCRAKNGLPLLGMVNQKLAADGLAVDDGQLAVDAERLQDEGDEVGEESEYGGTPIYLTIRVRLRTMSIM